MPLCHPASSLEAGQPTLFLLGPPEDLPLKVCNCWAGRDEMKQQKLAGPAEDQPENAENLVGAVQIDFATECLRGSGSPEGKGESCRGMHQRWESQWQDFLRMLQPSQPGGGIPVMSEASPWEDPKAFLASFEQVAKACQWPRGEWVARLLPALSGEAKEAFQSLEPRDQEDYGKVKAAILRGEALQMEVQRQHFRQFCCQEVGDPRRVYCQLQELCLRWLRPERHTKEQILELLILEQFLASLPPDLRSWIRAGGPDTCSQAVALAEDFLLNQQEDQTRKWQEVCLGPLDVEEVQDLNADQRGRMYRGEENSHGEASESGLKCPSHSSSLLSLEGPEMAETEQNEGSVSLQETGAPLQAIEQNLTQPGQGTMFWQVLQEEDGTADCFGVKKRGWIKMETSLYRGNEPEEGSRTVTQISPENVPGEDAMPEERCDRRSWIKTEHSQLGDTVLAETHRMLAEMSQWNFPAASNIRGQRWDSKGMLPQKAKNEGCEPSGDLTVAIDRNHTLPTEGGKVLLSTRERKYCYNSGLVLLQSLETPFLGPTFEDNVPLKCFLDKHQEPHVGEKVGELAEVTKTVPRGDNLPGCPKSRPDGHPENGKSCSNRKGIKRDQEIQTEGRRFQCTQCGKFFRHRQTLTKHRKIHTGEKLHKCLACGKGFTSREPLLRHQRIHTGEKPYECSQCGKCFRQRTHLMCHHKTHTGEKPFKCPECGRNFSRRDKLIRHQRIHRGQRPYVHPECGKGFDPKAALLKHQSFYESH